MQDSLQNHVILLRHTVPAAALKCRPEQLQKKFDALPERVQEALGESAGAAKEALLALSVGVELGVLAELTAEELDDVVGPKARHDADRAAIRHGTEAGQVTLGRRRVPVERPRRRRLRGGGDGGLVTSLRPEVTRTG